MEPTRTRTDRDRAAAEARSRPSTQFAAQYPTYPEQAQQLRRPPQQAPAARPQFTDLLERPVAPTVEPTRRAAAPERRPQPPKKPGVVATRRVLGLAVFAALTAMSVPLHVLAVFFMYVQIESPGELASAVPLLGGMLVAVFVTLLVVGSATQLVGGFPGRWRARVVFALLSGAIALSIAYAAALTQF
ncbi:hypothetical protein [Amnibacterium endophyticum]|uniref:MFS transporter n=1 Tax=Amnibacterium endophyticum TaxID=2109337 RepID=A0ABW4LCG2_9MICO